MNSARHEDDELERFREREELEREQMRPPNGIPWPCVTASLFGERFAGSMVSHLTEPQFHVVS